ncbi:hypothetical protein AYX15_07140 [Cryptococcus neoformans]|nr:hypothetical protein AYX15_07140 [Cryptococcus neoformans var. grubii]
MRHKPYLSPKTVVKRKEWTRNNMKRDWQDSVFTNCHGDMAAEVMPKTSTSLSRHTKAPPPLTTAANHPNSLWFLDLSLRPSVSLQPSLYLPISLELFYTCSGQHAHHLLGPHSVHESAV